MLPQAENHSKMRHGERVTDISENTTSWKQTDAEVVAPQTRENPSSQAHAGSLPNPAECASLSPDRRRNSRSPDTGNRQIWLKPTNVERIASPISKAANIRLFTTERWRSTKKEPLVLACSIWLREAYRNSRAKSKLMPGSDRKA